MTGFAEDPGYAEPQTGDDWSPPMDGDFQGPDTSDPAMNQFSQEGGPSYDFDTEAAADGGSADPSFGQWSPEQEQSNQQETQREQDIYEQATGQEDPHTDPEQFDPNWGVEGEGE